jgi:16S rRNA (guanine527-N7)-methyltransferase
VTNNWLTRALEESRARGFLGPNAIEPHITHAEGFALAWEGIHDSPPELFIDLGSGGGLPGLVLLNRWHSPAIFTDSMEKRMAFLDEVLGWEGAPSGAQVILGRAEEIGRDPELSEVADLVTARSFGPPAVTAECATRFLKIGGLLIVSEPPDADNRWNNEMLRKIGLEAQGLVRYGAGYQIIKKIHRTPEHYPRETGVPRKKPLF